MALSDKLTENLDSLPVQANPTNKKILFFIMLSLPLIYVFLCFIILLSFSLNDESGQNNISYCIVIGDGLEATKSYQLLIDVDSIQVNKIMTKQEYNIIKKVIDALDHTTKYRSPTNPSTGQNK
jgi:hypothetical protein